ncbi:MAG: hypothetical protein KAJ49_09005 [Arcobacteraceae bacterium]|nr:hypothetical protein [Arcobacteraceae bacterium]
MNIDRRSFIKFGKNISLMSLLAINFGCSIQPLIKNKNKKVALIYATRYGATKDTAQWIAQGLQRDIDLLNIEDISFSEVIEKYDLFIIGSGVWIDGVGNKLIEFLDTNKDALKNKIIASFILCGTTAKDTKGEERIEKYFDKFHASIDPKPPLNKYFGGRMIIDELNKKDKTILEHFYKRILKRKFVSWDRTEPKKAKLFGSDTKKYI